MKIQRLRKYGVWGGSPTGTFTEDITRCIIEVSPPFTHGCQCSRKRGYGKDGLYCKQHAKMKGDGRWLLEGRYVNK